MLLLTFSGFELNKCVEHVLLCFPNKEYPGQFVCFFQFPSCYHSRYAFRVTRKTMLTELRPAVIGASLTHVGPLIDIRVARDRDTNQSRCCRAARP